VEAEINEQHGRRPYRERRDCAELVREERRQRRVDASAPDLLLVVGDGAQQVLGIAPAILFLQDARIDGAGTVGQSVETQTPFEEPDRLLALSLLLLDPPSSDMARP
jgi:hypothetical protein